MSRPSSSTLPAEGRSNPLSTFTSVDLPAPFGPIRPTISPRPSSSVTSRSACTPANDRDTAEARSDSPGLPFSCAALKRDLDLRHDLRDDRPHDLWRVVLDADHAVAASEHCVQLRREADVAGDRRHVLEVLHDLREHTALRGAVRT